MSAKWMIGVLGIGLAFSPQLAFAKDNRSKPPTGEELFAETILPHLRIEISEARMASLRQHPKTYVPATVREGNTVFTNVSIRLKGGPGSFRKLDEKPAFTLNFGRLAEGQKFHGLKKLHLNNSVQDRSYLCEKISRELFEAAGVPAPRAAHATVELDGDDLGLYVLVEGINHRFLSRYFKNTEGNVYDGHAQAEVTRRMLTNSGDQKDQHRLRELAAAAQEPDLELRLAKLKEVLDLDRFLSFLATEVMICHWDGYAMNRNNYRIYDDLDQKRLVFIPQGMDQVFQRPTTPIFPQMSGLVAKSALEIPELRERYQERMVQLLTNVYHLDAITNHLFEVASRVQAGLAEMHPQAAATFMSRAGALSRRIQQRVRFLHRQLLSPTSDAEFDASGLMSVGSWEPQVDIGHPLLSKEDGAKPGSVFLHIVTTNNCAASWRSRVLLDHGQYRLHGRVRLSGVELDSEDAKAGVGLRISRQKFSRQISGDTLWTTVAFDFQVQRDQTEVELVCELRAAKGEVWFDQGSLRLIRQE